MPSPILHSATGYSIYRLCRRYEPDTEEGKALSTTLLAALIFSVLPDLDSIVGLIRGNFGRYHNNITHSFYVGLMITLPFSLLMRKKKRRPFWHWFTLTTLAYSVHILMDSLTWGRGVMAFWPFTGGRFRVPVRMFYGFHWSDGWWSKRHLWTALTELFLLGISALSIYYVLRRKS